MDRDFRTDGSRNPVDFTNSTPDCVAQAAILVTHTQGTYFADVDVLNLPMASPTCSKPTTRATTTKNANKGHRAI